MQCEMCGKNQASTFVAIMVNEKVKKMHLCETCAAETGLDGSQPISITDVMLGLGGKKEAAAATGRKTCPRCHMRFTDFKKTSRLGCQDCYETFAEELEPLLESMHKGKQHVGKKPAHLPAPPFCDQLAGLKTALAAAVKAENFEEAARIRDRIQACAAPPAARPPEKSS